MKKRSTSQTIVVMLTLFAVAKLLQFLVSDTMSAREMMCVVPGLIFTALIIHGATYTGKKQ